MYWSLPQKGWDTSSKKKDVKGVDGKGCLTNAKIDTFKTILTLLCAKTLETLTKWFPRARHLCFMLPNCPKNQNSYQYQHDMLNRTSSYKDKDGIPSDVRSAILPVYKDLCKRENWSKCLHGFSQSINKSFNEMIWNRAPKTNHVGQSNNVQIIYSVQIYKPF